MGILSNQGKGRSGAEPPDEDIAPLLRWALREQVSGEEPSDAIWPGIRARIAAQPARHRNAAHRLATVVSALVVAALALTVDMSYERGSDQWSASSLTEVATETIEPTPAITAALPLVMALPVDSVAPSVRSAPIEAAPMPAVVVQPRVTQAVDTQDDAMKPVHRVRFIVPPPVVAQPGAIVSALVRGKSPRPN